MDGELTIFGMDWEIVLIKATFFCAVALVALIVQHFAVKGLRALIAKSDRIPNASFITNTVRVLIWVIALIIVLEPVFGIKPTAFVTGLGVTSVVISLGLKDTVANVIGGLNLMLTDVISIGDYVTVGGVTGTVTDLTWRHTVVKNRLGDRVVIPNSILNTTAVVRLPASSESRGTIDFTMEPSRDTDEVARDIVETIRAAGIEELSDEEGMRPAVFFESVTPYGIKGQIFFYVRPGIPFAGVRNKIVRAVAAKPYFSVVDIQQTDRTEQALGV